MDEESRRIAELLARLSDQDRLVYRNLLIVGAYKQYKENQDARRRWLWQDVRVPPIVIGQLLTLVALCLAYPDIVPQSAEAGAVLGAAWHIGKAILGRG